MKLRSKLKVNVTTTNLTAKILALRKHSVTSKPKLKGAEKMENIKSKVIPKSLFLSAIFNLGRVVKSGSTLVNLNTFHLDTMVWSNVISQWNFRFPQICLGSVDLERLTEHKGTLNNFQMQSWLWRNIRQVSLKKLKLSIKLLSHSFRVVPP